MSHFWGIRESVTFFSFVWCLYSVEQLLNWRSLSSAQYTQVGFYKYSVNSAVSKTEGEVLALFQTINHAPDHITATLKRGELLLLLL